MRPMPRMRPRILALSLLVGTTVVAILATGLACLYFLFIGLVPDIVFAPSKGGAP